jgi:hypothetical protein
MGIFSKPKPIDPMFALPSVMSRECVRLFLPNKSQYPMANLRWVEIQFQNKQGQDYWVTKVQDSEDYFKSRIELSDLAGSIAFSGCEADGFEATEDAYATLFTLASFGLLAGMFEVASNATKKDDCHPLTWNALKFFNQSVEEEFKEAFGEKHMMLLECMVYAGYAAAKLEMVRPELVFSQWNK